MGVCSRLQEAVFGLQVVCWVQSVWDLAVDYPGVVAFN